MGMSEYIAGLRAKVGHDLIMIPGVAAIIPNDAGEVLLQRRSDNGQWGLPGGAIDPGEEPAEAVVREVHEETGLLVQPTRIVGVYGGHDLMLTYPNGDQIATISILFRCQVTGGQLRLDNDETLELRYFPLHQLPTPFMAHHRPRIERALHDAPEAAFYYQGKWHP
jgi:8-oxo-dGTP pyrophosphatase MutT (NUDIX family)